jgi:hypothetical protein
MVSNEGLNQVTVETRFTRGSALKRGAVAGAAAAGAGTLLVASRADAAGCSETEKQILDIAAIAEALAVTTYYWGIARPQVFRKLHADDRPYLRGALSAEKAHLDTLVKAGAAKPQHVFHYPPGTFASPKGWGGVVESLERAFVSAYGAAVTRFSNLNNPAMANLSARILGVEAEHRALTREILGEALPNNVVLEPALFTCVSEAATALTPFLNGSQGFSVKMQMPTNAQIKKAIGKHPAH